MLSGLCSSEWPLLLLSWSPHRCSTLLSASSAAPPEGSCDELCLQMCGRSMLVHLEFILEVSQSSCWLHCTLYSSGLAHNHCCKEQPSPAISAEFVSAPYLVLLLQSQEC